MGTFYPCEESFFSTVDPDGSSFLKCLYGALMNEIKSNPGDVNLKDAFEAAKQELTGKAILCKYPNGVTVTTYLNPQIVLARQMKQVDLHLVPDKAQHRCQNIFYYDNNIFQGSENARYLTLGTSLSSFNDRLCNCNCFKMMVMDEGDNARHLGLDLHFRQPS